MRADVEAGDGEFNEPEYPLVKDDIARLATFARHGNYRSVVPDTIVDQVCRTIANYGEDPDRYDRMIARARAWIANCFDAPLQAEAITRIYEGICAEGKPPQDEVARLYEENRQRAESSVAEPRSQEVVAATP
jgi:hypothetical protein